MKAANQRGFTLVELLIATTILLILAVGFTSFYSHSTTSIFADGEKSKAIAKAQNKLERLYSSMANYSTDPDYVPPEQNVLEYQNRDLNFSVQEVTHISGLVKGYNVTVVAFYKGGQRHEVITAFIEAVP